MALVMLAGMSVIVVSLTSEVALDFRIAQAVIEADQATEIARVGLEAMLYEAVNHSDWRRRNPSGAWISDRTVGRGSFTATGTDADGDLDDSSIDDVDARVVAVYGDTERTLTATLRPPVHETMTYLASMWGANKAIEIKDGPRIFGDLMSRGYLTITGSPPNVRGDIYCRLASRIDAQLADADTVVSELSSTPVNPSPDFDWFTARGERVNPPLVGNEYVIENRVISPTTNPHGFANAHGIYYINAGNRNVRFRRCHIQATIVLNSARSDTYFDDACVHAPAAPRYPAVLARGNLSYALTNNLSERTTGVDFNRDGDATDAFTSYVRGVVYSAKRFEGLQREGGKTLVRFTGAIVAREILLVGAGCLFEQDADLATNLVHEFHGDGLKLVSGSIRWD
jgi:hypothetical protein